MGHGVGLVTDHVEDVLRVDREVGALADAASKLPFKCSLDHRCQGKPLGMSIRPGGRCSRAAAQKCHCHGLVGI